MYSARSGRKIKPPPDGSVVDILSKYSAEDSDEDSEDEEYTPAVDKAKSVFKRNGFWILIRLDVYHSYYTHQHQERLDVELYRYF